MTFPDASMTFPDASMTFPYNNISYGYAKYFINNILMNKISKSFYLLTFASYDLSFAKSPGKNKLPCRSLKIKVIKAIW